MHGKQKFESQVLTFTSAVQFQVSCCCSSTFLSRCLPSSQGRQEQKENYWKPIFLFRELSKPLNPEQTFSIKHHQKGKGTFVWFLLGLKMLFAALYADAEPLHLRGTSKPFKVKQRRISHQSAASVKTCTSVPVESLKVCDIPASESSDPCKHTHNSRAERLCSQTHRSAGICLWRSSWWTHTTPWARRPAAAGCGSSANWKSGPSPCWSPASSRGHLHCPESLEHDDSQAEGENVIPKGNTAILESNYLLVLSDAFHF